MGNAKFTWTHGRGDRFSDPINIEFHADLGDVEKVFVAIPWYFPFRRIHDQYLVDGRRQNWQMASEHDLKSFWHPRYHIRLWKNNGRLIGSVHYEKFSFRGHEVLSFDDAKREVVDEFAKSGSWQINRIGPDLRNCTDRPANNGVLTIISKV